MAGNMKVVRFACRKCGTRGHEDSESTAEPIRCWSCGEFAYRRVGVPRWGFIIGFVPLGLVINTYQEMMTDMPYADYTLSIRVVSVLMILLAIQRCRNIGVSPFLGLLAIIPLIWIPLAIIPQRNVSKKTKVQEGDQ